MGELVRARLQEHLGELPGFKQIRGRGLMVGIDLDRPCNHVVNAGLERGLLINVTADTVVRLLPPLILQPAQARQLAEGVAGVIREFLAEPASAALGD